METAKNTEAVMEQQLTDSVPIEIYRSLTNENQSLKDQIQKLKDMNSQSEKISKELIFQMEVSKEECRRKLEEQFPDWAYIQSCLLQSIKDYWKVCQGKDYNDCIVRILEDFHQVQNVSIIS